jgi:hypothetical protein
VSFQKHQQIRFSLSRNVTKITADFTMFEVSIIFFDCVVGQLTLRARGVIAQLSRLMRVLL